MASVVPAERVTFHPARANRNEPVESVVLPFGSEDPSADIVAPTLEAVVPGSCTSFVSCTAGVAVMFPLRPRISPHPFALVTPSAETQPVAGMNTVLAFVVHAISIQLMNSSSTGRLIITSAAPIMAPSLPPRKGRAAILAVAWLTASATEGGVPLAADVLASGGDDLHRPVMARVAHGSRDGGIRRVVEVAVSRWLPTVLAALAVALGGWNAWQVRRVEARIAALEQVPAAAAAAPPRGLLAEGRPHRPGPPDGKAPPQLDDPEVRERFLAALDERTERFRETVRDEVARFGDEEGLDADTVDAVLAELDRRSIETDAIRADLKAQTIDRNEARDEIEDLRAESDAVLEDMLGPERFSRLADRLFGDRGAAAPRGQLHTPPSGE